MITHNSIHSDSHITETVEVILLRPLQRPEINAPPIVESIPHVDDGGDILPFQCGEKDVFIKFLKVFVEKPTALPHSKMLISDDCYFHRLELRY